MFVRGDRVSGWFGQGIVTDVPQFDNVVRIMQKKRHGKPTYRYVLKADATRMWQ